MNTMHMIIIHGDNQFESRRQLGTIITQYKQDGFAITRLEAAKITLAALDDAFGTTSLFAQPQLIIIEGVHSLPTSQKKKEILQKIVAFTKQVRSESESAKTCVLWESRTLTKPMLKPFVELGAFVKEYPISQTLFRWLDSLSTDQHTKKMQLTLLAKTIEQENEFVIFTMLCRQIRLLLEVKTGGMPKVAPFILTKLQKQARVFTEEQLLAAHKKLYILDLQMKSSKGYLSVPAQLDLFVITL